jgi:DNA-binding CsgD family transcriptional regulator
MKKREGFTNREVALLDAWDRCNRPQIDDAFEARVLAAVHEAGRPPCEHELDPQLAAEDEEAVVTAMVEDAAEACLEIRASENETHRSGELEGAGLRQEEKPSGEDDPDARKQRTPVTDLLRVVEEILRETAVPMSAREIVERAGARLPIRSETRPDVDVMRDLSMDIKRQGEHSIFVRTSPDRYTLRTLAAALSLHPDPASADEPAEQVSVLRSLLTAHEHEVLELMVRGKSSREIAQELKIDLRAVDGHRCHIMDKLKARNVMDMIRCYWLDAVADDRSSGALGGDLVPELGRRRSRAT